MRPYRFCVMIAMCLGPSMGIVAAGAMEAWLNLACCCNGVAVMTPLSLRCGKRVRDKSEIAPSNKPRRLGKIVKRG